MKVVFFEVEDWEREYLVDRLGAGVEFSKDILGEQNAGEFGDAEIVSVFIYSKIDAVVLDKFPNLKAIVTRSTGFDHIDIGECEKRGIRVLNVPYYGENTVAEHTFAMILDLSRKIHKSHERTVRGDFSLDGLRGFDLKEKTIGIIGLGHIGRHVARIAHGFEMKIAAYDLSKDLSFAKKFGIKYLELDELLRNSDIVSIHCPYNKDTHHLINGKNIGLMKKGAYLVNTARGGNVETEALVGALARGELGGAALDVLEGDGLIKEEIQLLSKNFPREELKNLLEEHLLLTFENVIITPHNAFNSKEALQRILNTTVENVEVVLKGAKSGNFVGSS